MNEIDKAWHDSYFRIARDMHRFFMQYVIAKDAASMAVFKKQRDLALSKARQLRN